MKLSPSNGRLRIGSRLRSARQAQSLTIEDVASMSGLSKGFISRVERDMASPSVATLISMCEILSVPVGSLFVSSELELVRAEDAPPISLGGIGADERLLTPRGQSSLQLIRSRIAPRGHAGDELYTINCDVEVVHVLEGTVEVIFEDLVQTVEVGDTLTFRGREPHSWRNPSSDEECEILWAISPAPWTQHQGDLRERSDD